MFWCNLISGSDKKADKAVYVNSQNVCYTHTSQKHTALQCLLGLLIGSLAHASLVPVRWQRFKRKFVGNVFTQVCFYFKIGSCSASGHLCDVGVQEVRGCLRHV